jgi:hypothetical protein
MKKIIAKINPKTGKVTMETQGFSGDECLKETEALKTKLGLHGGSCELTPEYYTTQKANDISTEVGGS